MSRGYILLALILLASAVLHFARVWYPASPVFDEKHFATYASDYLVGRAHLDIHPPLGKMIYAGVLSLAGGPRGSGEFIRLEKSPELGFLKGIQVVDLQREYGDFPYVALRVVSILFGVALAAAVYAFARRIHISETGALLAAFFVAFENAILLQTRLVLLDGMYLVFGLLALVVYFDGRRRTALLAGALFGLALGVKLVAILFIGPILISWAISCRVPSEGGGTRVLKFFGTGFVILLLIYAANSFFFSPAERFRAWQSLGVFTEDVGVYTGQILPYIRATTAEAIFSLAGYIGAVDDSLGPQAESEPDASSWYRWPVMQKPIRYHHTGVPYPITLSGNPVVWFAGTLAVVYTILQLVQRRARTVHGSTTTTGRPARLLLGGYVFALLPFALLVHRATYLYHYFPALLFALCLLGWLLADVWEVVHIPARSPRERFILALVVLVVTFGFLAAAPGTYGFRFGATPWG